MQPGFVGEFPAVCTKKDQTPAGLVFFGTSGDTAFFEKPSNINGFWVSEQ